MRRFAILLVGLALMVVPASAVAASSQCQVYGSETCSSIHVRAGQLPFTGVNASLVVLLGIGLVGAGVVVRRTSRA
jgi:hypothetical protein